MGFKTKFTKEYGFSYEAFRVWLRTHHETTITECRENDELEFYVGLYNESKLNSNFVKRNGFSHRAFATYVWNRYEMKLSEICEESYDAYLVEYKDFKLRKDMSKPELFELLEKYIVGASNGSEIELTEKENKLITHLEENL